MRHLTALSRVVLSALSLVVGGSSAKAADRPNVVWIIAEDMSPNLSCYGETTISTPHIDSLASEGILFSNAYVTGPVCSTSRSALVTGMYQTSIGAHHHRSGRGAQKIHLPKNVCLLPKLFRDAGYYTANGNWPDPGLHGQGKTDYNFEFPTDLYDGIDWSGRKPGQPFFCQIQTHGGKNRGDTNVERKRFQNQIAEQFGSATPASEVRLPPYYPRDQVLLEDWAAYLDCCRETDALVGGIIQQLKDDQLFENTVIIFTTDHGISHARGKQYLYDEGIHVPLLISGPGIAPGQLRQDLVEHIDIAALSLALAGIAVPESMQGRDILAKDYKPRTHVFAARDRCDETVDHIRCVRTDRFKYIRNFLPSRPHLQPCAYKDRKAIMVALRSAKEAGSLNGLQDQLLFSPTRSPEELYDLQFDPYELHNVASDPQYQGTLVQLRNRLNTWMDETEDLGRDAESDAMYESDMAAYLENLIGYRSASHIEKVKRNIQLMKDLAKSEKE